MSDRSFVRYMYLRDYDGNPHTCIAIQLVGGGIYYATATYNIEARGDLKERMQAIRYLGGIVPADMNNRLKAMTPFTKKRAREIATARLNNGPAFIDVMTSGLNYHQITRAVMESICCRYSESRSDTGVATRLENAAYIWICEADDKIREMNRLARAVAQST